MQPGSLSDLRRSVWVSVKRGVLDRTVQGNLFRGAEKVGVAEFNGERDRRLESYT